MAKRISDARAIDLDETRRLLYMMLVASKTKRYNLAGTIINALKHHQRVDIDPDASPLHASDALVDHVVAYVNGEGSDDEWLTGQIHQIVRDLGEDEPD